MTASPASACGRDQPAVRPDARVADLVTAMTGEASPGGAAAGRTGMPAGEPVLAVTGLSYAVRYADVGFEVGAGEITRGREQE